jgi:hypothetical protein
MATIHSNYVLCARWILFVTHDSSSVLLHEAVAPSSAGDQLFILLPAWRAGPSPIPPTRVDPISLRVQAPSRFSVGHNIFSYPSAYFAFIHHLVNITYLIVS